MEIVRVQTVRKRERERERRKTVETCFDAGVDSMCVCVCVRARACVCVCVFVCVFTYPGAPVDGQDPYGNTVLHTACQVLNPKP